MANGQITADSGSSAVLVGAFTEMDGDLTSAEGVLKDAYAELELVHRGGSGTVYRQGLDEIQQGLTKVRNALGILQGGVHGTGQINTGTEELNRASAGNVGLSAPPVASWT
ncbi:hypothetical protein ACIBF5_29990 [Micromonospora sp. NPDC050417]|uniref:hypothetical protein n=1 Tax=Micromonospora sp. NPDC050417 TaxID=3364280 RepID=UPI0037909F29